MSTPNAVAPARLPPAHLFICPPCNVCPSFPHPAGDFVTAISGRGFDTASRLAELAAELPSARDAILVSDAARQVLASSHGLVPAGGAYELTGHTSSLPGDGLPPDGARGRGAAPYGSIMPGQPRAAPGRQMAAAARRQWIRKKYEALELLLARGEGLAPAPEYLLTQPPPVGGGRLGAFRAVGSP